MRETSLCVTMADVYHCHDSAILTMTAEMAVAKSLTLTVVSFGIAEILGVFLCKT